MKRDEKSDARGERAEARDIARFKHELAETEYQKSINSSLEGNQTERDLCSQLMLIATVVFTVTGAFVTNNQDYDLRTCQTAILIGGLILLLASIGSGLRYYFALIKFHQKWGKLYRDKGNIFVNLQNVHDSEEWISAGKDMKRLDKTAIEENSTIWLKTQVGLLVGAGTSYLILIITILAK